MDGWVVDLYTYIKMPRSGVDLIKRIYVLVLITRQTVFAARRLQPAMMAKRIKRRIAGSMNLLGGT